MQHVDSANVLVIVLISSHRVSATVAWMDGEQGEKVVAHKPIDCNWHTLSERGKRQTVADVVKLACESAGVEAYSAYIAMSDGSISSMLAVGYADLGQEMELTASDRDQALLRARHQAIGDDRELVHALPVRWTVRNRQGEREVADPVGVRAVRLTGHVLLVTARKGYRDELTGLLESCGLAIDGVIAPPVALYHGIAGKLKNRGSTLVIDCGARHTSLLVHRRGVLYFLKTYEFGGDTLTRRLSEELHVPADFAEDLKREIDVSFQTNGGDEASGQTYLWREVQERHRLIAPAARLSAQALREFFSARAQELREQELLGQQGQIHLVGRASALGGLSLFLKEIFDLPVVLGTGSRDRDPSAELVDLLISGVVRAAADQRRRELAGQSTGLRGAASGLWAWLTKRLE
jgi:cell division protein FtsA